MSDLGEPVDDLRDLGPEVRIDFGDGDVRILDDVVNEPARDGDRVELKLGENLGDLDAVRHEVLARQALLSQMRGLAEAIRAHEEIMIEPLRQRLPVVVPARDYGMRLDCGHTYY